MYMTRPSCGMTDVLSGLCMHSFHPGQLGCRHACCRWRHVWLGCSCTNIVRAHAEAAERADDPEVARRERLTALFYALGDAPFHPACSATKESFGGQLRWPRVCLQVLLNCWYSCALLHVTRNMQSSLALCIAHYQVLDHAVRVTACPCPGRYGPQRDAGRCGVPGRDAPLRRGDGRPGSRYQPKPIPKETPWRSHCCCGCGPAIPCTCNRLPLPSVASVRGGSLAAPKA